MSLTNVANTGSKAHLSFACTQAKLSISSEGGGMEIVIVNKQVVLAICLPQSSLNFVSFSPLCCEVGISLVIACGLGFVYVG